MFESIRGDAATVLQTMEPKSVHCCVTSPPYYKLRDYGHPDQIGQEEKLGDYISNLTLVARRIFRVLRDDGTLWLNLGDSIRDGQTLGVPWLVAFALRRDGWRLCQEIIWHKPNPMPENVTNRCTQAHEYIFLLAKNKNYYFDSDAIREPASGLSGGACFGKQSSSSPGVQQRRYERPIYTTRNKRSVWTVGTGNNKGSHFAIYPEKLIEPCILAGCPRDGIVLDPFMGTGTTGIVANKHGRHFIGIDIGEWS